MKEPNDKASRRIVPANDNGTGDPQPTPKRTFNTVGTIKTDLPERLPVIDAEIILIETYLADLVGMIIANDN